MEEGEETYAGKFAIVVVPVSIVSPLCLLTKLLKIRLKKLLKCELWLSSIIVTVSNQKTYCLLSSVQKESLQRGPC